MDIILKVVFWLAMGYLALKMIGVIIDIVIGIVFVLGMLIWEFIKLIIICVYDPDDG